jgi:peptidyl-prolyl cis-trans isomerase A (cyclophilin A)
MRRRPVLALAAVAWIATRTSAGGPGTIVRTRVETALGAFDIEVDTAVAPVTVANYLAYVDRRLLDRASVYRVVTLANQPPDTRHKIEVVQWGLDLPDGQGPALPAIAHETTRETGLRHLDGTVSMARSQPGTATSEFFICIGDQPALDFGGGRNPDGQGFAAFGRVVSGQDVVKALHAKGQATQRLSPPIAITSVRRVAPAR